MEKDTATAMAGYRDLAARTVDFITAITAMVNHDADTLSGMADGYRTVLTALYKAERIESGEALGSALDEIDRLQRKVAELEEQANGLIASADEVANANAELRKEAAAKEREAGELADAVREKQRDLEDAFRERDETARALGEANARIESLERLLAEKAAPAEAVAGEAGGAAEADQPEPAPALPVIEMHGDGSLTVDGEPTAQFENKKSGLVGRSPRSSKAQRFRLTRLKDGEPVGFTDEGTASELAKRNGMSPSEIYKWAGGRISKQWKAERI